MTATRLPRTADELVEYLRRSNEELAKEVDAWRCPTEMVGYRLEDEGPPLNGPCGARVVSLVEECSATEVRGMDDGARELLAYGIDPGPPRTEVRPLAYDLRFTCENGHEHYVRTRHARRAEE